MLIYSYATFILYEEAVTLAYILLMWYILCIIMVLIYQG
uniref:Uncharacterized protein n=1 Tax=Mammaliicoccus phage MSShimriz1 TaxID=3230127 RepID=A0AAU8GSI5_9VIRU